MDTLAWGDCGCALNSSDVAPPWGDLWVTIPTSQGGYMGQGREGLVALQTLGTPDLCLALSQVPGHSERGQMSPLTS